MTSHDVLKADLWREFPRMETDQRRGVAPPPTHKPCPDDAERVDLVATQDLAVGRVPLTEVIRQRRSRRRFTDEYLSLEELSFLLWATQGVSGTAKDTKHEGLRTVPSGGGCHPFESYLIVKRVEGLAPGLYRYLPTHHQLCFLAPDRAIAEREKAAWGKYRPLTGAAVVFIWSAIPYRTEWQFGVLATKIIAQDSGHLCQNLYLASESIGAGTCAVGWYNQAEVDALIGVDGEEEFTIYLAPVGKVADH